MKSLPNERWSRTPVRAPASAANELPHVLGGGRSPAYLLEVLHVLSETIPRAQMIVTPEFDHNAPDLSAPKAVAELIRA